MTKILNLNSSCEIQINEVEKLDVLKSIKTIDFLSAYIKFRENNKILNHLSKNISLWKIIILIMDAHIKERLISIKDIVYEIQCSSITANSYIHELIKLNLIILKNDVTDKRKKNIKATKELSNAMNDFFIFCEYKISNF
tara:strand:- start:115 stop:534 length:420 start_codon:yes stop_codon:yes gene_type:complete